MPGATLMAILCPVLQFPRSLSFFSICDVLFICPILLSRLIALCSLLPFVSSFKLSSHPVLYDLLRSFRIERPLPSSRFPPWDLLRVLSLLRGAPFEPLESCSLQDLTSSPWPLLVALASSRLSLLRSLPLGVTSSFCIFRSSAPSWNPPLTLCLVPSVCVILLAPCLMNCPCALCVRSRFTYVVLPLSPHPRSLFVSPRTPPCPLSKNALSFFLRSVISLSFPPSSSSHAHSIRVVSTSVAFSRNVPLASILAAATWSSSTVFTSFYLRDVQFSSSSRFSLGSLVAADAVV